MYNGSLKKEIIEIIRKNPLRTLCALWLTILILAIAVIGFTLPRDNGKPVFAADSLVAFDPSSPAARASYADVVEKVAPAVVTIRSDIKMKAQSSGLEMPFMDDPLFRQFFGNRMPLPQQPRPQIERASGSGVIVTSDGTILTNNHVIEGATKVTVELPDKRSFSARIVGTDKPSDLAVLKIDASNLPVLPLGNSDAARVGDVVLAIGYPLGLRQTVTSGIVSAKGRSTGISDGSFEDFIQTDAPINHGNSGGALVNLNGELIGINSQILSPGGGGSIGIGFAIPSNMAKNVMEQLVKNGKVSRGMLGIGIQNVTSDLAQQFGLKEVRGVIVNSVKPNSPADKAGLKQGDVITAINGAPIDDTNQLRNRVADSKPGSEITLTIVRDGREQTAKAVLTEFSLEKIAQRAQDDGEDSSAPSNAPTNGKLGVSLQALTPQLAAQLGLKGVSGGVIVAEVEPGSPADDAGIQPGDLIQQINRQTINSTADVKNALAKSGNKPILLLVNRKNQTIFVTVTPQQ
jgi:serine protease Do